jgi:hypothetical protein
MNQIGSLYLFSTPAERMNPMNLNYRGIPYTASQAIATPTVESTATYRGHSYNLHLPVEVCRNPQSNQMTYRGVAYADRYQ